jgi:hypothetical protein
VPDAQTAPATGPSSEPATQDRTEYSDGLPDFCPQSASAARSTGAPAREWTSQQVFFAFGEPGWFESSTARTRALVLTEMALPDALLNPPAGDFPA